MDGSRWAIKGRSYSRAFHRATFDGPGFYRFSHHGPSEISLKPLPSFVRRISASGECSLRLENQERVSKVEGFVSGLNKAEATYDWTED